MAFWTYILKCADESYYTGHTDNLEKRIAEHEAGVIPGYTANKLPVTLVFVQEFQTREYALASERQIKGWNRKKKEAMALLQKGAGDDSCRGFWGYPPIQTSPKIGGPRGLI